MYLQKGGSSLCHCKMGSANLLDELKLEELRHVVALTHTEHIGDDVLGAVAELPQVGEDLVRLVNVCLGRVVQHVLHQKWVRLIAHLGK